MARRRKKTVRRIRTAPKRAFKRVRRRKSSNSTGNLSMIALGGATYGGVRQLVSNKLAEWTQGKTNNFIGEYSDEVTMGLLSYALAKGKIPILNKVKAMREVGKAGLYIESARIGANVIAPKIASQPTAKASIGIR